MYCKNCGNQVGDGDVYCSKCGQKLVEGAEVAVGAPGRAAYVPNYLVWSILITLCCFFPTGIVAIVYSAMVNSKLAMGDHAGAVKASKNAKIWCWVSFALGIIGHILFFIFGFGQLMRLVQSHGQYV